MGELAVTVVVQVAVPTTLWARVQVEKLSVFVGLLISVKEIVPVGVDAGPLSVSVTVTVKFVP